MAQYLLYLECIEKYWGQQKELHVIGQIPNMPNAFFRVLVEIVYVENIVPPIFVASSLHRILCRSKGPRCHKDRQQLVETHKNAQGRGESKVSMQVHREDLRWETMGVKS